MSTRGWTILCLSVIALLAVNYVLGWQLHVFLGRKLIDLIEWMAFWR